MGNSPEVVFWALIILGCSAFLAWGTALGIDNKIPGIELALPILVLVALWRVLGRRKA